MLLRAHLLRNNFKTIYNMNDYQIWGFTYLNYGDDNINAITGDKEEAESEFEIPCFDGVAYFKARGRYYVADYPEYNELTDDMKSQVKRYCGYEPDSGEYGVIMGALGIIEEVTEKTYKYYKASYEVSKEDIDQVYI